MKTTEHTLVAKVIEKQIAEDYICLEIHVLGRVFYENVMLNPIEPKPWTPVSKTTKAPIDKIMRRIIQDGVLVAGLKDFRTVYENGEGI